MYISIQSVQIFGVFVCDIRLYYCKLSWPQLKILQASVEFKYIRFNCPLATHSAWSGKPLGTGRCEWLWAFAPCPIEPSQSF